MINIQSYVTTRHCWSMHKVVFRCLHHTWMIREVIIICIVIYFSRLIEQHEIPQSLLKLWLKVALYSVHSINIFAFQ